MQKVLSAALLVGLIGQTIIFFIVL